jgi:hypothetical protein
MCRNADQVVLSLLCLRASWKVVIRFCRAVRTILGAPSCKAVRPIPRAIRLKALSPYQNFAACQITYPDLQTMIIIF